MNKRQAKKEYYYGEYLGIRRYNAQETSQNSMESKDIWKNVIN